MVAGGRENGRTVRSSNVHDDDGIHFGNSVLPRTETLTTTMFTPVETVMGMDAEHFSFDHAR